MSKKKNTEEPAALESTASGCYVLNWGTVSFHRAWAIPSHETFRVKPIKEWVQKYIRESKCSIDPFARDCEWATYTNDFNPKTRAAFHLQALDFLIMLENQGVVGDLSLFDPPYSWGQLKRMYEGVGLKLTGDDTRGMLSSNWRAERDVLDRLIQPGGYVLSFGWNSNGMQRGRGYELRDVLLCCHGSGHNDTICIAEQKVGGNQLDLHGEFET